MTVAYCTIIKNEVAHGLEEGLKAARPFVDEMVIVDTGSTDGSVEVAKKYADAVYEIEWPDSFSEARNYGLDRVSEEVDYIMYFDGDEVMAEPKYWKKMRSLLENKDPDGLAFRVFNELPGNQILEGDSLWQVRLFRNHPDIRFRGRVHNQITPSMQEVAGGKPEVLRCPSFVRHKGYSYTQEELTTKYEKRVHLLEKEVEDADPDSRWYHYYQFQLGNAQFMMNEYDKAWSCFAMADPDGMTDENAFSMLLMMAHCALQKGLPKKALESTDKMLKIWAREPISFFLHGAALLKAGQVENAYTFLLASMQLADTRKGVKYQLDSHYAAQAAGEAALKAGRLGEAKELLQYHLDKYPDNEKVRQIEQAIIKRNGESEDKPIQPSLETG